MEFNEAINEAKTFILNQGFLPNSPCDIKTKSLCASASLVYAAINIGSKESAQKFREELISVDAQEGHEAARQVVIKNGIKIGLLANKLSALFQKNDSFLKEERVEEIINYFATL